MSRRFPEAFLTYDRLPPPVRETRETSVVPTRTLAERSPSGPVAVFTPEGYEPNYAYPLVVWFHDAGESEHVLRRVMPIMSDRNALGLALRGEQLRRNGFDWAAGRVTAREKALEAAVRNFRRQYHVHTERVVLAGRGAGAAAAAELFFHRPDWYGGLALFAAPPEAVPVDLTRREELIGKPVLLDLPFEHLGRSREDASRLAAAGVDVTVRRAMCGALRHETLRHLNKWLLGEVCGVPV
jgi:phospholipase/carboxylesterase